MKYRCYCKSSVVLVADNELAAAEQAAEEVLRDPRDWHCWEVGV